MLPAPEWVLDQPQSEIEAWYIAIGEYKGGEWDYDKGRWMTPPQPEVVYAVPAELKSSGKSNVIRRSRR